VYSNPAGETYEGLKKGAALEAVKAFAHMLGIENLDVKVAKVREQAPEIDEAEALSRVVKETLGIAALKGKSEPREKDKDPKRIVTEDKLEKYLAEGWDVQTVLPSGKILVRRDY